MPLVMLGLSVLSVLEVGLVRTSNNIRDLVLWYLVMGMDPGSCRFYKNLAVPFCFFSQSYSILLLNCRHTLFK